MQLLQIEHSVAATKQAASCLALLLCLAALAAGTACADDDPGMIPSLTRAEEEEIRKTGILMTPMKAKMMPFLERVGREVLGIEKPGVQDGGAFQWKAVKKLEEQAKSDNPNIRRNALRKLRRYRYIRLAKASYGNSSGTLPLKDRRIEIKLGINVDWESPAGASVLYRPRDVTVNGRKAYADGGLNAGTYVPNGFHYHAPSASENAPKIATAGLYLNWSHDIWSVRMWLCRRFTRPFDLENDPRWRTLLDEAVKYGDAIDKMLGDPPQAPVAPPAETGLLNPKLMAILDPAVVQVAIGGKPRNVALHALPRTVDPANAISIDIGEAPEDSGVTIARSSGTPPPLVDFKSFALSVAANGSAQPGIVKVPLTVKQGDRHMTATVWVLPYHEHVQEPAGGPIASHPPVLADAGDAAPEAGGIPFEADAVRTPAGENGKQLASEHLARARAFGRTRYQQAVQAYGQALELTPDNALAWSELGTLHVRNMKFEAAIKALREAVRLKPNVFKYRSQLADALFYAGRQAEGMQQAREAVRLESRTE